MVLLLDILGYVSVLILHYRVLVKLAMYIDRSELFSRIIFALNNYYLIFSVDLIATLMHVKYMFWIVMDCQITIYFIKHSRFFSFFLSFAFNTITIIK